MFYTLGNPFIENKEEINMYFDEKLKKLRLERGISVENLARALNISTTALEDLEIGFRDPSEQDWEKITDFFKVAREELADDQPAANAFAVLFGAGASPALTELNVLTKQSALWPFPATETIYEYPEAHIRAVKAPTGEYLALKIPDGNLRELGVFKGDTAIVQLENSARTESLAAALKTGGVLRFVRKGNREIILSIASKSRAPENLSEEYQPCGQVVEIRKDFWPARP
jgi:transcriptional regulator with XRE-family HTH domain